jgi:hypothetical protein
MLAYCRNCWTIELPWLDCEPRPDDDCVAEDEEEAEEGFVEKPVVAEGPGNEIDMASPQNAL